MSRGLPAILFVLLTVLAGGSAFALNLVIARLAEVPDASSSRPALAARESDDRGGTRPPRALSVDEYLDGIMGRNLFDIAMIDAWAARRPGGGDGDGGAPTDLRVKLLGTIVADPEVFSSALIADESTTALPRAYSLGDMLYDREVVSIEHKRVALKKPDGSIEYVTMDGGPVRSIASTSTSDVTEEAEGVREVADGKYEVNRDTFDKYINDLEGISRMGRALLHRGPDGEFDGYRLSAIRRGTLADQLGIKNGDIIHSVNGEPLNSVQAAMNAYNTMKSQSNFCFEISRRGSPQQLCYDVR